MNVLEALGVAILGLGAGVVGGLAGIGGSLIMLPGLHLIYPQATSEDHHSFIAAAMTVNVAVALPSALQHGRAGAVRGGLLRVILPAALVMIAVGVLLSNTVNGDALALALAVFILIYCGFNAWRIRKGELHGHGATERTSIPRLVVCGGLTGLAGGLLGLGGGLVLVPMLQLVCRVPLRQAIATSSGVICVTAVLGAGIKLATLKGHGQSVTEALTLAALMAPLAIVGGRIGAWLTHSLPIRSVRIAVTVLLLAAAGNLIRAAL